jgi:hypothetical protein
MAQNVLEMSRDEERMPHCRSISRHHYLCMHHDCLVLHQNRETMQHFSGATNHIAHRMPHDGAISRQWKGKLRRRFGKPAHHKDVLRQYILGSYHCKLVTRHYKDAMEGRGLISHHLG